MVLKEIQELFSQEAEWQNVTLAALCQTFENAYLGIDAPTMKMAAASYEGALISDYGVRYEEIDRVADITVHRNTSNQITEIILTSRADFESRVAKEGTLFPGESFPCGSEKYKFDFQLRISKTSEGLLDYSLVGVDINPERALVNELPKQMEEVDIHARFKKDLGENIKGIHAQGAYHMNGA